MTDMIGRVINDKFIVGKKVGAGSYGTVYSGYDIETKAEVALKFELKSYGSLQREYSVYRSLRGCDGIPKIHWYGTVDDRNVLVMDVLGPSLKDVFRKHNKKFSLKTILILADQMLFRIQSMHEKNYIHCDLKPSNLLFDTQLEKLHIIDFGLSTQFYSKKMRGHVPCTIQGFKGTPRYASINSHLSVQLSRRDDLESIAYILVYLFCGSLPWQGLKIQNKKERYRQICIRKEKIKKLCTLPREFNQYLDYCRSLYFDEEPNYRYLRSLFRRLFFRLGYENDGACDWTIPHQHKKSKSARTVSISRRCQKNVSISRRSPKISQTSSGERES